ncbi:MAG: ABC transporter substrate-binding protein [Burkholderiaceae bacterium]
MNASKLLELRRREFLARTSALGAAGLFGVASEARAADPPPEIKRVRLVHAPFICLAPQYLAEEFFRMEGFTDWEYLPLGSRSGGIDAVVEGRADITMWDAHSPIPMIDAGKPIVVLAGVHGGCYQLFCNESVRTIRDLKGKSPVVHYLGGGDHVLLSSMLAQVGVDPSKDVNWTTGRGGDAKDLFAGGKADAFMAFAQEPAELRAKNAGRVILNTAQDRPWSQYYCCVVIANRDFVARNPVATKRVLRSILKASDICAADPERVARFLVDMRYETRYPIGLEVLKNTTYTRWRHDNPEDTLRFHTLRLREGGLLKSTPQQLIAKGTDWRFLNELKKEMKT